MDADTILQIGKAKKEGKRKWSVAGVTPRIYASHPRQGKSETNHPTP